MSKTVHMVIKTRMLLQNQVMENQILIQKKAGLIDGGWVELQLGFQQTHAEEIEVEEHSASTNRVVYFDLCLIFLLLRFSLKK